jgi:bifunctional non-homologous end joining protein LigD
VTKSRPPPTATRRPPRRAPAAFQIPGGVDHFEFATEGRSVRLTSLAKPFWPERGITKRDLLQFYADVSPWLLPHLRDRAMVMKRYPNGATRDFFFMKRAPTPRPDWIETCSIEHDSGDVIDFPMVQDLLSLLWVVNLGCIDLNPWYARCDDIDRPDWLYFDLDPVADVSFARVRDVALLVRRGLEGLGMTCHAKTTGSRGIHVVVPIARGPLQKDVWAFAKRFAVALESQASAIVTTEYRVAKRPAGRVLVDYNQNAWGRTLASIYSVRPRPLATVSMPVTWSEIERGVEIEEFRIDNAVKRLEKVGDLWAPVLEKRGRFRLERLI